MKANSEDRVAVARSVTISIITVVFVVLGLASTVTNYIIRPQTDEMLARISDLESDLATLKRSNAAHFGQIKSMLKTQ
jgi:hypothetical protein